MHYTPLERSMLRAFGEVYDDGFHNHPMAPYWHKIPDHHSLKLGSVVSDVTNTSEKFAVSVDVSHFKPEELKVNLVGHELTIEGHHEEKNDHHGTIQRSFVRKYTLPADTNMEGIRSVISDKGHLSIEAPKKTAHSAQMKAIPILRA